MHVTASCTSLSRTQLSPDRARISYSFSWILWYPKTDLRDERQRAWKRRQIWEMRDERQRAWSKRQIWEMGRLKKWEWWDKFRVRKYAIYTSFFKRQVSWTGPVRFGSIGFRLWKPKPNRIKNILWFSNRFNWFFFTVWFFRLFFFRFLGLIGFLVFLLTPKLGGQSTS